MEKFLNQFEDTLKAAIVAGEVQEQDTAYTRGLLQGLLKYPSEFVVVSRGTLTELTDCATSLVQRGVISTSTQRRLTPSIQEARDTMREVE